MNFIRLILCLAVMLLPRPSLAQDVQVVTIGDFVMKCPLPFEHDRSSSTAYSTSLVIQSNCIGLVRGISDVSALLCHNLRTTMTVSAEAADVVGVSFLAMWQAMLNYAQENPRLWEFGTGGLIYGLSTEFPCT